MRRFLAKLVEYSLENPEGDYKENVIRGGLATNFMILVIEGIQIILIDACGEISIKQDITLIQFLHVSFKN